MKPFKSEEGVKKDEEGVRGRRSLKREIKEEQEHKEGIKKEEVKQEELKLKAEEDEDSVSAVPCLFFRTKLDALPVQPEEACVEEDQKGGRCGDER